MYGELEVWIFIITNDEKRESSQTLIIKTKTKKNHNLFLSTEISVSAKEFAGLTKVKQHRLVADALPVKDWHGFVLHTSEAK